MDSCWLCYQFMMSCFLIVVNDNAGSPVMPVPALFLFYLSAYLKLNMVLIAGLFIHN